MPLSLDTDKNCHARRSSGVASGWDLKEEEYEGGRGEGMTGKEEDERRRPRMECRRSRSTGEVFREHPIFKV
jgi:hypothetical protein